MGLDDTGEGEEAALCPRIERCNLEDYGLRRDERGRYGRAAQGHTGKNSRRAGTGRKAFDLSSWGMRGIAVCRVQRCSWTTASR